MQVAKAFLVGGTAGLSIGLLGHGLKNLIRGNQSLTVIFATVFGALAVIGCVIFVLRMKKVSARKTPTTPPR